MIIEKEYIPILSDALESFTLQPEEYNIPYDIYTSTEFEEFHTGFSTNDAKALIEQLSNGNHNISDSCINYIYNIVLSYKSLVNFVLLYETESPETKAEIIVTRKSINALIRFLKSSCSQNNIELYILDDESEEDDFFFL
jgi:hypothetical protein